MIANPGRTLYTSDTHFFHENVIGFCGRPFRSVEEMNEVLILNWNSKVSPEDTIYHLGDVTWKGMETSAPLLCRLNGRKILIKGNHDRVSCLNPFFSEIHDYLSIRDQGRDVILMHFPIEVWDKKHYNSIHLHGHTHDGLSSRDLNRVDVGVDSWGMMPVCLDEVLGRIAEQKASYAGGSRSEPEQQVLSLLMKKFGRDVFTGKSLVDLKSRILNLELEEAAV